MDDTLRPVPVVSDPLALETFRSSHSTEILSLLTRDLVEKYALSDEEEPDVVCATCEITVLWLEPADTGRLYICPHCSMPLFVAEKKSH